jgi:precorrin-6B methylase 2
MTEHTERVVEIVARAMEAGMKQNQRAPWMDDADFAETDRRPLVMGEIEDMLIDGCVNLNQVAQAVLTALSEAGKVVVDVEPTDAMMEAAWKESDPHSAAHPESTERHQTKHRHARIYCAMLKAATGEHSHAE